jgi:hypothetical protein
MVIQARKRFVVALIVALFLAVFAVASAQVMVPSGCKTLTPWSFDWVMRQCYIYAAFPSDFAHRPFLVR